MDNMEEAVRAGARAILAGADMDAFYAQGDWESAGVDIQQSMLKASRDTISAGLKVLESGEGAYNG